MTEMLRELVRVIDFAKAEKRAVADGEADQADPFDSAAALVR